VSSLDFNPGTIIEAFNDHGVDYVVIGAVAAIAQDAPIDATTDIDFVPSKSRENLERLSLTLFALGARVRTDVDDVGLAFDPSHGFLGEKKMLNLVCGYAGSA
jgi:hypothetical protein